MVSVGGKAIKSAPPLAVTVGAVGGGKKAQPSLQHSVGGGGSSHSTKRASLDGIYPQGLYYDSTLMSSSALLPNMSWTYTKFIVNFFIVWQGLTLSLALH